MATLDDTVNSIASTVTNLESQVSALATAVGTLGGQITQPTVDFTPVLNALSTNQAALVATLNTVTADIGQVLTQLQPTPAPAAPVAAPTAVSAPAATPTPDATVTAPATGS